MPQVAIDHVEIRWRPADTAAAWTTERLAPGSSCITIDGVYRGATYQIEARNVGVNGAASPWTQQTHTVDSATDTPLTPTNLAAVPVVSGVSLTWTEPANQAPDAQYDIERCGDNNGQPDGTWANVQTVSATSYIDPTTVCAVFWYRLRAVNFSGLYSAYTSPVSVNQVVVPPTNLTVTVDSSTSFLLYDGTCINRMLATWTPSVDPFVVNGGKTEIQYQMRSTTQPSPLFSPALQGDGSWLSAWVSAGTVDSSVSSFLIPMSAEYQSVNVRIRAVRPNGAASVWVNWPLTLQGIIIGRPRPIILIQPAS